MLMDALQDSWPVPQIDRMRCTGCTLCVRLCPTQALAMQDGHASVVQDWACVYTGTCELVCPTQAIQRPFEIVDQRQNHEDIQSFWDTDQWQYKEKYMQTAAYYPDWQETIVFGSDGPQPQKLIETESFRAVLVGLEAGQTIPPHPAPVSVYHILEGSGWMIIDEQRFALRPGVTLTVPAGARRGVEAETRLAFLGAQAVQQ